jgi:hypothetical protein
VQLDGIHGGSLVFGRVKRLLLAGVLALVLPASAYGWGGTYPTGDTLGTSIKIDVSDTIPVDDALPQSWATFLGTLVHGPELASLHLVLAPIGEVERMCGYGSLACYDPASATIEASPDDQPDSAPAKQIISHEYGHHIAHNRTDAPWSADDWGTKRWASYMGICKAVADGWAVPGDESLDYSLNPGEAFAETYRVLNLRAEGVSPVGWDLVDRRFFPDATALALLQEDIVNPWTGATTTHVSDSFGGGGTRTIPVKTTLDGRFVARLHAPTGSGMQLALYAGTKLIGATRNAIVFRICGERALTLRVVRGRSGGTFTVDITKP